MSLKSIKKNYTTLLKAFSEAGVKLNESQKDSLDNFVMDLEKTLNEQRDQTILATKKVVEEKLEKEYKEVVESIIKHQKEHSELAGKVQDKVNVINESNKIADAVDSFLGEYVEEVLPKKALVDYEKMQKLEKIQESLKEMFLVSDVEIEKKTVALKESLEKEAQELKDKLTATEDKVAKQEEELSSLKAEKFVQEKVKDLPDVEAEKVMKKTEGMGLKEVTEKYETILESVQQEIADEKVVKDEGEKNLEEAITEILEKKNGKASDKEISDKDVESTETNPEAIGDSVVVTESQMQSWIETLNRITPQK